MLLITDLTRVSRRSYVMNNSRLYCPILFQVMAANSSLPHSKLPARHGRGNYVFSLSWQARAPRYLTTGWLLPVYSHLVLVGLVQQPQLRTSTSGIERLGRAGPISRLGLGKARGQPI